jgi:glycosyltransferase involved in cell wall biosynthesis
MASKVCPTYHGGLASYQKALLRLLAEKNRIKSEVIYAVRAHEMLPDAKWPAAFSGRMIRERRFGSATRAIRTRFASRPITHSLLEMALAVSWDFPRDLNPDVILFVGNGWDIFGFAVANFARRRNCPFVVCPGIHPGSWGDDTIDFRLYDRAERLICFSESERDYLRQCGVPKSKSIRCPLHPMCCDDGDATRFRAKYDLESRLLVLFLGRRDKGKGYPRLLEAWRKVNTEIPNAVLILAGPLGDEYGGLLHSLPNATIRDLGIPTESEKADALAACDVFCLPSSGESFGLVFVEAWSYGKPVVCGPAPACREFIEHGRTGLWSSQDPDELAEKIMLLLRDTELRDSMGLAGLAVQREQFNEHLFLNAHLQALGLESADEKELSGQIGDGNRAGKASLYDSQSTAGGD